MTKLLERAVERVLALPPDMQDEVARTILSFAGDEGEVVPLTSDERAAVERSLDAAARGDFATEAEVQAVWTRERIPVQGRQAASMELVG